MSKKSIEIKATKNEIINPIKLNLKCSIDSWPDSLMMGTAADRRITGIESNIENFAASILERFIILEDV